MVGEEGLGGEVILGAVEALRNPGRRSTSEPGVIDIEGMSMIRIREIVDPELKRRIVEKLADARGCRRRRCRSGLSWMMRIMWIC